MENESSPKPGTEGHWQFCTDVNSRYISFEFERETGRVPLVVFVDEKVDRIMVGFSDGWSTPLDVFLPGFEWAVQSLKADVEKGYSGVEP